VRSYDAVLVDFANVLTTPLHYALARFALEEGIDLAALANAALGVYLGGEDDLVVAVETGRIGLAEFEEKFAARLSNATGKTISPEGLVGRLFAGLELETTMMSVVGAIRASGFKTGLVSNSWSLDLYPRRELDEIFDAVVISGEVGLRKPDPAIFQLAVDRLGVSADRCVVVDDDPGHLEVAAGTGMQTVLHISAERTIAALEDLLDVRLSDNS
jgi:putative hydrolase of the HAD superfamily